MRLSATRFLRVAPRDSPKPMRAVAMATAVRQLLPIALLRLAFHRLVFFLDYNVLDRRQSDIGELVPGDWWVAEALAILYRGFPRAFAVGHLAAAAVATYCAPEVCWMRVPHVFVTWGKSAAQHADIPILVKLLARMVAIPFDTERVRNLIRVGRRRGQEGGGDDDGGRFR